MLNSETYRLAVLSASYEPIAVVEIPNDSLEQLMTRESILFSVVRGGRSKAGTWLKKEPGEEGKYGVDHFRLRVKSVCNPDGSRRLALICTRDGLAELLIKACPAGEYDPQGYDRYAKLREALINAICAVQFGG